MANQVTSPGRVTYRYGLLPVAQTQEHAGSLRLHAPYTFDSVACNSGSVWEPECAPEFTVTFAKSATADTFDVTVTPGVVGDYEVSVNGGAFAALTSTVVSTDPAPTPVVVREAAGLQRSVTQDLNFDAATGTVYTFQSEQTNNSPKTFTEGIGSPSGSPFVVIGGATCTPMADYDWESLAREALQAVEEPQVERRFWERQLATSSPALPEGSTAQSVTRAIAVLEEHARGITSYEATLHTSSYLAAFAASQNVISELANDQTKYTALRTPIAFGGGYPRTGPTGQPAPTDDQAWIFLTGAVLVHRGEIFVPGSKGERFTQSNNQLFIMAERSYAVIPDCPIAAVLADTSI
jgi:hypothetical protein